MSPDPAKIQALKSLPEPKDEKLLQSFLGMVNYLLHDSIPILQI